MAASASSTASVENTDDAWRLLVDAPSGPEANVIAIARDAISGDYLIEDQAGIAPAPLPAGSQCHTTDATHVTCAGGQVQVVNVTLGAGDDKFSIADSGYPTVPGPVGERPLSVTGDAGIDTIDGGRGDDDIRGGDDNDSIFGGGGDDTMSGDAGNDTVDGGEGADAITGDVGGDTMFGGPGDDDVQGDQGDDTLDAGAGDDEVRGNDGADTILGGVGDDRLDFPPPSGHDPTGGADTLRGGDGSDVLNAGPAAAQQGPDDLGGGDGMDEVDFSDRTAPLNIDLNGRDDDGEAGEHDNVQPDVENVISGSNDDVLTGSAAPNLLDGRGGEDTIGGGDGDDTLVGGVNDPGGDNLSGNAGSDRMTGGPGDDELAGGDGDDTGSGGGGTDTVEGEDGNDSLTGGAGGDTVNGGDGNDTLYGGEVALVGGDAADNLNGGPGADTLYGGRGEDQLDGGFGPDYISGDAEKDTVSYEDRTSKVYVTLDGQANDGEAGENDNVLPNVEAIVGGRRGDDLSGDADGNTVDGGDGEDLLTGDSGADRLLAGDAPDLVQARDGIADEVTCGAGGDLAIADAQDKVIDCETTDRPGARRLIVRRYALLRPQGEFGLQLPAGRRFFRLTGTLRIPIGATVDPESSVMRLATARNRSGAPQNALVSAGRFTVRQRGDRRPITELRLAGALPDCSGSSRRGRAATPGSPRRLNVDIAKKKQRGRYAVRGKYSVAAATGTAWLTEDRCDGTLTTVKSGTVRVLNLERDRTVIVKAGHSYLARPR